MGRGVRYACAGGILSTGAPLGLVAVRLATKPKAAVSIDAGMREIAADAATYAYVGVSTAAAFALLGYLLGRQADRLARLSETDALTGLANTRGFFRRLDSELDRSRRYRTPLALLLVDLDRLKAINDRHGHRAGDEAIRTVAGVIRSELRRADLGARLGGDEFAILASSTAMAPAVALAGRIAAKTRRASPPYRLTTSIGVAAFEPVAGRGAPDAATLVRAADRAMYDAKRGGRDMVVAASLDDAAG